MATFRDLVPRQLPQDELAMPRSARITGETVAEAVARGVQIQYVPIVWRDLERNRRPLLRGDGAVTAADGGQADPKAAATGAARDG